MGLLCGDSAHDWFALLRFRLQLAGAYINTGASDNDSSNDDHCEPPSLQGIGLGCWGRGRTPNHHALSPAIGAARSCWQAKPIHTTGVKHRRKNFSTFVDTLSVYINCGPSRLCISAGCFFALWDTPVEYLIAAGVPDTSMAFAPWDFVPQTQIPTTEWSNFLLVMSWISHTTSYWQVSWLVEPNAIGCCPNFWTTNAAVNHHLDYQYRELLQSVPTIP